MLVGIGGKSRAGKDTLAQMLQALGGWQTTMMSSVLVESLAALDPLIVAGDDPIRFAEALDRHGYEETKRRYPEAVNLLVRLGNDVGRDILGSTLWVDKVFDRVDQWVRNGWHVAVTGIRYPNEIEALRQRGGLTVYMHREEGALTYGSDEYLQPADFEDVIENTEGLQRLREIAQVYHAYAEGASSPPRDPWARYPTPGVVAPPKRV